MANDSDEFDKLRKLLALKRHEAPPPGYFERLPREIHVRLAAAQAPRARREDHAAGSNWLAALLRLVEARSYLVGAMGAAACGLVLTVIVQVNKPAPPPTSALVELAQPPPLPSAPADPTALVAGNVLNASTNPILPRPPAEVIFNGGWLKSAPAAYPQPAR